MERRLSLTKLAHLCFHVGVGIGSCGVVALRPYRVHRHKHIVEDRFAGAFGSSIEL